LQAHARGIQVRSELDAARQAGSLTGASHGQIGAL